MNLYTIRDLTAQYYMQPFGARNHAEALRSFENAVKDTRNPDNLMAKHPSQFGLYFIGNFDDNTGQITAVPAESLGLGSDYANQ